MQAKDTPPNAPSGDGDDAGEETVVVPEPVLRPTEYGGPKGPEPTRYGDWERKGRCVDF